MDARTGDILLWRSTCFYDILSDLTIGIKGLHSGLILVGREFGDLSVCGKSPTHTYVTYLINLVFPIEEIVGRIWTSCNGSCLYHIKRTEGPNVDSKLAIEEIRRLLSMECLPIGYTVYIAVAAYFRYGGLAPTIGYDNKSWRICSLFIEYLLRQFGLLSQEAVINNILPVDFFNLKFYQRDEYVKYTIFDKGTHEYDFWFTGFYNMTSYPVSNPIVETILSSYPYPRYSKSQGSGS